MKILNIDPFVLLNQWILDERHAGAPNPQQAVLSTATAQGIPHARVIAIREIIANSFVFFTQRGTRKAAELQQNAEAVITFWFELHQRQVIVEGKAEPLSEDQNLKYWQSYSKEAQIRFYAYAPTSSQVIEDKQVLEDRRKLIEMEYYDKKVPISQYYCGFRLTPARLFFYAYRLDELSDVFKFLLQDGKWSVQRLSP